VDKDTKKLVAELERQGFTCTQTKRQHTIVRKNGFRVTTLSGSASDWRSWHNSLADLRAAGFKWPPPDRRGDDPDAAPVR
jgi:hypothetical protein